MGRVRDYAVVVRDLGLRNATRWLAFQLSALAFVAALLWPTSARAELAWIASTTLPAVALQGDAQDQEPSERVERDLLSRAEPLLAPPAVHIEGARAVDGAGAGAGYHGLAAATDLVPGALHHHIASRCSRRVVARWTTSRRARSLLMVFLN